MDSLLNEVNDLEKGKIRKLVDQRMLEFKKMGKKDPDQIFCELCFCLLTANYDAAKAINIQNKIGGGFCDLPEGEVPKMLKKLRYRFPNVRAKYIVESRNRKDELIKLLKSKKSDNEKREWIVKNIKGLVFKEASHFLRNIGYLNCASIDFHIVDILVDNKVIKKPKTITPKIYLEIEKALIRIANKLQLNLAELDLYLWYLETGKILK